MFVAGKEGRGVRTVRRLDHRVDHEAGQDGAFGMLPQHLGIDDFLDRDQHLARRLRHDGDVRPIGGGFLLDIAESIGAVGVDQGDVGNQGAAGQHRQAAEGVVDHPQVFGIVRDQVGADGTAGGQEG